MNSQTDNNAILEKPVETMMILVHLYQNEKTTITQLLKDERLNQQTSYSALVKLQKEGLVIQKEKQGFPLYKYYLLTEKGKIVAEKLEATANMPSY